MSSLSLKVTLKKKEQPVFVADIQQLDKFLLGASKQKLVIGGQLTIGSLDLLKSQGGFIAQPSRAAQGGLLQLDSRRKKTLQLLIDKDALDKIATAKRKVVFAIDPVLKYGLKLKGKEEHCVIAAIEGTSSTQVLVLKFKKQSLTSYSEYNLSHPTQTTYEADLHLLFERLTQDSTVGTFHWCGPVTKPKVKPFTVPSIDIWQAANPLPLTISGRPSAVSRHGVPLALIAAAVVGYATAVYVPYSKYETARAEMLTESSNLKGESSFTAERLAVLRSRQGFFQKQQLFDDRFSSFVELLAAFSQEPNMRIRSATLLSEEAKTQNSRPGMPTEYDITVEVPSLGESVSALDQGEKLLNSLSQRTGTSLRLATGPDSYRGASSISVHVYKIQGDLKK